MFRNLFYRSLASILFACSPGVCVVLVDRPKVSAQEPFGLQFIDEQSQRPIPLVEIQTVHHLKWVSDNQGWIAIDDPELLGSEVFFHIRSPGYEIAKDGFGFAGKSIVCSAGARRTISLKRVQLAERLYRTTGIGRYSHSNRLGLSLAFEVLNSSNERAFESPVGCDSVLTAVLGQKMHWFWGDTQSLHYPLGGSFHMTGATTDITWDSIESHPPSYEYFRDETRRVRPMAQMPGEGPTWISGVTVLKEPGGDEVMLANYVKVRNQLEAYRWGFVRWDAAAERFEQVAEFQEAPKLFPPSQVHTFQLVDGLSGQSYVYFCGPFPDRRVRATKQAFIDPTQYEGFTCLQDGTDFQQRKLDRDPLGALVYRWRRGTLPLTQAQEQTLVGEQLLQQEERRCRVLDIDTDREVQVHNGSVAWNPHRNAWSMIFTQLGGETSMLGEVWYSESKSHEGPWARAKKVAGHHQYSFYNPKVHPEFFGQGGRILYFEGTYTTAFSGNGVPAPGYEYNQILYRLDLEKLGGFNFRD